MLLYVSHKMDKGFAARERTLHSRVTGQKERGAEACPGKSCLTEELVNKLKARLN